MRRALPLAAALLALAAAPAGAATCPNQDAVRVPVCCCGATGAWAGP